MPKQKIPDAVRTKVWDLYIGIDKGIDKCFCCNAVMIQKEAFQCGHVISEYNGGRVRIENLRPICPKCNFSMGKRNMREFMDEYGFEFRSDFNGRQRVRERRDENKVEDVQENSDAIADDIGADPMEIDGVSSQSEDNSCDNIVDNSECKIPPHIEAFLEWAKYTPRTRVKIPFKKR
jgi:hypothetical protein